MTEQETDRASNTERTPRLTVRNVGGIAEATIELDPGVTLVTGRNATNKSSLLRSLIGVLGGPVPRVKSDADTGSIRLTVGSETYSLELARDGTGTVVTGSETYSEAAELCELFVALTETNPIRQAVLAGDDLYDLLMRPVDTDEIAAEIRRLRAEKDRLDDRLAEFDDMADRLPDLRERYATLEAELEEVETALERKRDAVADIEADLEQEADGSETASQLHAERTRLRNRLATTADAIDSLETELEAVTADLEDCDPDETETISELEADLETLHRQKQELTSTINALAPLVELNTRLLDDEQRVPEGLRSDDVTADLDPSTRTVSCWTCGSPVERSQIETQLETVQSLLQDKRNRRDTVTERIQLLTERKRELDRQRTERAELRDQRAELRQELAERRETRSELEAKLSELEREIEDSQTDGAASERKARLAEYREEISDLEYERGRLATDLDGVESELDEIEAALSERSAVESRREAVAAALTDQRERVARLERDLVDRFNEVMQAVLDTLRYDAIERVWLERRAGEATGHVATDATFELHVVRSTEDGAAYDDTVENLSKSEREVIGLVVSLAGYLAHDVGEQIPFIVVDAVEMFDAERIRGLVEQFGDHAEYVVATVLPEEHERLRGTYDSISTATLDAGAD
jgi:chromosome segregation ATPase